MGVISLINVDMTEKTLQIVLIIFSAVVAAITLVVVGTFCVLVIRDGNNPLVTQAFTDLASLAQNAVYAIAAVIVGKPVASGILQFFQGKAIQASTQNVPVTSATLPVNSVPNNPSSISSVASSQSAQGPYNTAT